MLVKILKAGATYFAIVFGVGFVLGPIRVLVLVPRLGERLAELLELPVMLVVIVFAARWLVRRFDLGAVGARFGSGAFALALMLAFEFGLVLPLRGLSIPEYFATRDPVSGTAYSCSLLLFAAMPTIVGRVQTAGRAL